MFKFIEKNLLLVCLLGVGILWILIPIGCFLYLVKPPGFLNMWFEESCDALAVDADGNIYVGGQFSGPCDFDPGKGIEKYKCNGTSDIFLSKFDPDGNLIWARTWGGNIYRDCYDTIRDLATDSAGNIYATGEFLGAVDFDPGPGVAVHNSLTNENDVFLSKFDPSGNFLWACTWGGKDLDYSKAVSVAESDIVSVAGVFFGKVDFDTGPGVNELDTGSWQGYTSRFDSSGKYLDVAKIEKEPEHESKYVTKTDREGNTYAVGDFGTSQVLPFAIQDQPIPDVWNKFLARLDSSGDPVWVKTWDCESRGGGSGLGFDESGNVYVTGNFSGKVDFDPGPGVDEHKSIGDDDLFLSKFDSSGNFIWARTWGGQNQSTPM